MISKPNSCIVRLFGITLVTTLLDSAGSKHPQTDPGRRSPLQETRGWRVEGSHDGGVFGIKWGLGARPSSCLPEHACMAREEHMQDRDRTVEMHTSIKIAACMRVRHETVQPMAATNAAVWHDRWAMTHHPAAPLISSQCQDSSGGHPVYPGQKKHPGIPNASLILPPTHHTSQWATRTRSARTGATSCARSTGTCSTM